MKLEPNYDRIFATCDLWRGTTIGQITILQMEVRRVVDSLPLIPRLAVRAITWVVG